MGDHEKREYQKHFAVKDENYSKKPRRNKLSRHPRSPKRVYKVQKIAGRRPKNRIAKSSIAKNQEISLKKIKKYIAKKQEKEKPQNKSEEKSFFHAFFNF